MNKKSRDYKRLLFCLTVNDKHRKPEFKIRVGVKFKEVSGLKAIYGLQLYLKETSTNVFSCQYCKMF